MIDTITTKVALSFEEITQRLKGMPLPAVDHVIGIGTGGTVLAAMTAFHLEKPLSIVHIHYRADDNTPEHPSPVLVSASSLPLPCRVLLVDDVSVSGQTLAFARAQVEGYSIWTLVIKGSADFVLFPEVASCIHLPWRQETK